MTAEYSDVFPGPAVNDEYIAAFGSKSFPGSINSKPEMLLISAGFDAHADDPLGADGII